ncbi:MAG: ABC transporter substrate-binding protein [Paracoccaceae bacterium]
MRLSGWVATLALATGAAAAEPDPAGWDAVLEEARGQTVWWHAWGGSAPINDYIAWAAREVEDRHGVRVEHVKLSDTAEAVSRVAAEKAAGVLDDGAVDLLWINGENFAAMKEAGLLFGPWAEALPNWRFVDVDDKPVRTDFTVPTEGLEAPWATAQIVFYHDAARAPEPPRSMAALADWAEANPGRFAYPQPPDFLGSTFLKQALVELSGAPEALYRAADEADYEAVTAPLWTWLDRLTPNLWRGGRAYPQSGPRLTQLMADGEIDLAVSFDPSEAASAVANFELPETVRTYVLDGGTLGNVSFVAIPFNSGSKAGAMVLADFLLSPEAQARKADPAVWGAGTVLDVEALPDEARARFEAIEVGPGGISAEELGEILPEPHPSWMTRLEEDWQARFGVSR